MPQLKQSQATEWRGPCPIHHGTGDNFAVDPNTGLWYCHSTCAKGGDILQLEGALTGGDFPTCKTRVLQLVGGIESATCSKNANSPSTAYLESTNTNTGDGLKEVERYPYQDVHGNLLSEVIRYEKPDGQKCFSQCRPDGHGGVIGNLGDSERVPYRL